MSRNIMLLVAGLTILVLAVFYVVMREPSYAKDVEGWFSRIEWIRPSRQLMTPDERRKSLDEWQVLVKEEGDGTLSLEGAERLCVVEKRLALDTTHCPPGLR